LRKDGVRLKLQGQPFQILLMLLQKPGEVVSRDALRAALWPADTYVDFEHSLNTAVKKLRQALGDEADKPSFIETLPRIGYRFLAPVDGNTAQSAEAPPPTPATTPPPPRWRSRSVLFLVALAVVIVLAGVLIVIREQSRPPYLRITATKQLTFSGDVAGAIETDGRRVYYVKFSEGHLYSVPVGGGEESSDATRLSRPRILHISLDGSTLLVKELSGTIASRLWLQPTNGGPARALGDIEAGSAAWSPDGKDIAFSQGKTIYLTEDGGATYHRLVDAPGEVSWIRWSPDGQRLRFTMVDSKTRVSSIWEALRSGEVRPVPMNLGRPPNTCCGVWTRDGRHFLFREFHDERTDYWLTEESRFQLQPPRPFPLGGGGLETAFAAASPLDNSLFVVGYQSSKASFKFEMARRQLTPLFPERSVDIPTFSADGQWLAYVEEHTNQRILWRSRSDGSDSLPLTDPKLYVMYARYSPDGKRIALMGKWPDQQWKIYWISADGGALHELNVPVTSQCDPNWMPEGQSILFGQTPRYFAEPDSPRAIYVHNLKNGSLLKVPGSEGWFSPRLSPDGRSFLAISIDEDKLAVHEFATSQWRILAERPLGHIGYPMWSLDGKWAYFSLWEGNRSLLRTRISDGLTEKVLAFDEWFSMPQCLAWNMARDGAVLISCLRPDNNIYALKYE
jgi:Tol biopolymer transport system component/DNA-binding winged helix-turn-helix (wHTH) protein